MTLNFFIIQAAPGGPVEQMIARLEGVGGQGEVQPTSVYKNQGLDEEMIAKINALYGFDKPLLERYILMLKNYLCFEFGSSFYKNTAVIDLLLEKLPVSISLGLWSTLLIYLISIPLGIQKALKEGSTFDSITSTLIIIGNAIPTFLFALILIIFFCRRNIF